MHSGPLDPYGICDAQTFSPAVWMAFSLSVVSLGVGKFAFLMPYNFPIFSFNCLFAKCHLRLQSEVIQVIATFFSM